MNEINQDILKLHKQHSKQLDELLVEIHKQEREKRTNLSEFHEDLVPMFYPEFENSENKILILGINPSHSPNQHYSSRIDTKIFSYSAFTKENEQQQEDIIKKLISIQEVLIKPGENQILYFSEIQKFATYIGYENNWCHYDIFANRCTDQSCFLQALNKPDSGGKELMERSLNRFMTILAKGKFKMVLILNGGSSKFVKKSLNEGLKKVEDIVKNDYGLYTYTKDNITTKILLFKQLSGRNKPKKEEIDAVIDLIKRSLEPNYEPKIKTNNTTNSPNNKNNRPQKNNSNRDHSEYIFNEKKYRKGRLVLAVIKDYVARNPNVTLEKLIEVFPNNIQGSNWIKLNTDLKAMTRFFIKDSEIIALSDDVKVAVSREWGNNINRFLEKCEELKIKIHKIE